MQLARQRLRRYLRNDPEIKIVGESSNGNEAIEAIRADKPELVFLDVQMPEIDGFQVVEKVGTEEMPPVIFITAFDHFALRAFEVHAIDYLLKPFDEERLRFALNRAKNFIQNPNKSEVLNLGLQKLLQDFKVEPKYVKRLAVKSAGKTIYVHVDEIDWVGAAGNYLEIHVGKQTFLIREKMGLLETKLDPDKFVRIHRSTLINVEQIKELHPLFNGDQILYLRDGSELIVSRTYRDKLISVLEGI